MLLAVDIGNSNIVFGLYDSGEWVNHWRIQTDPDKTADEYEVIFRSLVSNEDGGVKQVEGIIICSVVPTLVNPFMEMLANLFSKQPALLEASIYNLLPVKVLNPNQIGTDLVANSVAAFTKFGKNTMVIDFGTALTFTTIGNNAEILGVAIAPGLKTAIHALASNTAQLPYVQLDTPPSVLGDNTVHAIQSGVVIGYCGLVDSIIEKTREELGGYLTVVATGGLGKKIAPMTNSINHMEPLLTLNGLQIVNGLLHPV